MIQAMQSAVRSICPAYIPGQELTHEEGTLALQLFLTQGMEGDGKHPALSHAKIHGFTTTTSPLGWNHLVAHMFMSYNNVDRYTTYNMALHNVRQEPHETMIAYMSRTVDMGANCNMSCTERAKLIVQGLHASPTKNQILTGIMSQTFTTYEDVRHFATRTWTKMAQDIRAENGVAMSEPPNKWCPKLLHQKTMSRPSTSGGQSNYSTQRKPGEKPQGNKTEKSDKLIHSRPAAGKTDKNCQFCGAVYEKGHYWKCDIAKEQRRAEEKNRALSSTDKPDHKGKESVKGDA